MLQLSFSVLLLVKFVALILALAVLFSIKKRLNLLFLPLIKFLSISISPMMPSTAALLHFWKQKESRNLIRELDLITEDEYEANLSAVSRLRDELYREEVAKACEAQADFVRNFNRYPKFRKKCAARLAAAFDIPESRRQELHYTQGKLF